VTSAAGLPSSPISKLRSLHTMIRVRDLEAAREFFCNKLGLHEIRRREHERGRFTLVFLTAEPDAGAPQIELTHNWDQYGPCTTARHIGHLASEPAAVYAACQELMSAGVTTARPPRGGRMACARSADEISVELPQEGEALPRREPWASMGNAGEW